MANYECLMRSNYVQVKDPVAFEAFCKKWDVEMVRGGDQNELFGFLGNGETGTPLEYYDVEKGEYVDGNFLNELASHLADEWVAVVREIGFEKMRYLVGYTVAVNARGETVEVSLDDVYDEARRLGENITGCDY